MAIANTPKKYFISKKYRTILYYFSFLKNRTTVTYSFTYSNKTYVGTIRFNVDLDIDNHTLIYTTITNDIHSKYPIPKELTLKFKEVLR